MPSSKPFTVMQCDQRSQEWRQARAGVFTASRAGDVFAKTAKGEWKAYRKDYKMELVCERTTGQPLEDEGWKGRDVDNGIKRESGGIRVYENITGSVVLSVGFVLDNDAPIGCSPDGVVGDYEGLVQVKSPKMTTHCNLIAAVRGRGEASEWSCIEVDHQSQLRHELYVTGAAWVDYISYHPQFPPHLRMLVIRMTREDAALEQYAKDVRVFLDEVEAECEKIAGWAA